MPLPVARPSAAGLLFLALAAVGGCQPAHPALAPTQTMNQDRTAIEATLRAYGAALNASDTDAVLATYTADGVFMPAGAPTATGTSALRASYDHVFSQIAPDLAFDVREITVAGDLAFALTTSQGRVTVRANGQAVPDANRETFVLRREGGAWKIARYMFNKSE